MPQQSSRIVLFFRELRRRSVFKTLAMYGATAFILMEAADIMLPRLGLPDWTVTFVIVLLIVGLPIALVLSWIFDVTPQGIQKTPSEEEVELNPELGVHSGRKKGFTLSHFIIILLLAVVCILLYPKIFSRDQFKTFRNEAGQISLVILPFENHTGDSSMDWFSTGISSLLTNGLGSSDELMVYNDQGLTEIMDGMKEINTAGITGSQARDIAGKVHTQVYLTGSYQGRGNTFRILANLVSTDKGEILLTRQVEGNLNSDAYLELVDSLCNEIRDQLEIQVLEKQADFDFRKAYTHSAEAYRYYIDGMNALIRTDFDDATELLDKALNIDSTFAFAAFSIAMAQNFQSLNIDLTADYITKAYEVKSSLPLIYQQWIDLWHTCVFENDLPKLQQQLSTLESGGIDSRLFWYDMAITHQSFTGNMNQALKDYERVAQISEERGDPWRFWMYYKTYGQAYRAKGMYLEEEALYRQGLEMFSDPRVRKEFYYEGSVCAISRGDSAMASELLEGYRKNKEILGELESYEFARITIYFEAKAYQQAEAGFKAYLQKYPEDFNAKFWLVRTLIVGDLDPENGLEMINVLLDDFPGNLGLLDLKAYAFHKLGRDEEALALFEKNDEMDTGFKLWRHEYMQEVREELSGNS